MCGRARSPSIRLLLKISHEPLEDQECQVSAQSLLHSSGANHTLQIHQVKIGILLVDREISALENV
jgi:hypothetical protein